MGWAVAGVHFVTRSRVGGPRLTFGTYTVLNVTRNAENRIRLTKCTPLPSLSLNAEVDVG